LPVSAFLSKQYQSSSSLKSATVEALKSATVEALESATVEALKSATVEAVVFFELLEFLLIEL
jgi:hypothetical protein